MRRRRQRFQPLRQAAALARWLGPWAHSQRSPPNTVRSTLQLHAAGVPLRCYRYAPRNGVIHGCYLVVQGLHFAGPEDPRMDRFCRVLAACGLLVIAPCINVYRKLRVHADAAADVAAACDLALASCQSEGLPAPAIFSISFGSAPALRVASDPAYRDRLGGVLLFGGYADFFATIRFALSRRAFEPRPPRLAVHVPHDPLNIPAVMINVIPHVAATERRELLAHAWLEMARQTWGQPSLRAAAARWPLAERIATDLPRQERQLFYGGCGLLPGASAHTEAAFVAAGDYFDFTDPQPLLGELRAPLVIAHGRDDDVIPFTEALRLHAMVPAQQPSQLVLTGLYGHTGAMLPAAAQLRAEGRSLVALLNAIVAAPTGGLDLA